jgi:hypothetical protein
MCPTCLTAHPLVAESDVAKAGFFRRLMTAAGVAVERRYLGAEAPAS